MTSAQMFITATIILYLCFVICTGVLIGRRSRKAPKGFIWAAAASALWSPP